MTGTPQTRLAILRGNSGSGKSTTARELRARLGRGVAWVEQDYVRRILLREHDYPGAVNIGLIEQTVRYSLDHDFDVVLDGILDAERYGAMLRRLSRDHVGVTGHYYFDIPFEETIRRHATRPLSQKVTAAEMRGWYRTRDVLDFTAEHIIGVTDTLDQTVVRILADLAWESPQPRVDART